MKKGKTITKQNLPLRARNSWGGDYADGHWDENGNQTFRSLTSKEKEWLNNFNDGYCLNNHRHEDSVFRQLPDYETRVKQELDLQTNKRNRDIKLTANLNKVNREAEDIQIENQTESMYKRDELEESIVIYGFSVACDMLIEKYDEKILETDKATMRASLFLEFGIKLHKLIQDEKSQTRKMQKKGKKTNVK